MATICCAPAKFCWDLVNVPFTRFGSYYSIVSPTCFTPSRHTTDMPKSTASLATIAICVLLTSHVATAEETYVQTVRVPQGASNEDIVKLSTRVLPHRRQVIWHRDEFIAFIHYGPNAFTRREWGSGDEDPNIFHPTDLDTDQWCDTMKRAGIKRVVITVKHHDGFCLWQTRYTKHAVASSKWHDGQGDVLADLSKSCQKYNLKLGIYLSPADLHQIRDGGLYGNLSKYRVETIPTPVAGRDFANSRTFQYEVDDYNLYFMNQLYELLTEYGPIYECWFDGAHPKRKGGQTYNYKAWFEMIHTLAPHAMIAVKGPDTRWCGNESGGTRPTEFNVLPLPVDNLEDEQWPDRRSGDLASRAKLAGAKWLHYYPAETNTSIRHGWFYRDDEHQVVRDADNVFDIYERAVGGNSAFLLNIPPNREGKFSPRDVKSLVETGRRIREVYGTSLSKEATGPAEVLDNNAATYWKADSLTGSLEIKLPAQDKVNRFLIQEPIATQGQRIEAHALDAWLDGQWTEIVTATSIGYKRILRFPTVSTDRLRLRITASRATPLISRASAHYFDEPPNPVQIRCDANNRVTLYAGIAAFTSRVGFRDTKSQRIRYTTDGSEPNSESPLFNESFTLPDGGIVKSRTIVGKRNGSIATKIIGYPRSRWKILSSSSTRDERRSPATRAIDGSTHHGWISKDSDEPHHLAIDLQKELTVGGFTYLPPNNRDSIGMIEHYRVEISNDGESWSVAHQGEFGNIVNDPVQRIVYFEKAVQCRYFRLVSVASAAGSKAMGVQELQILAAKTR